jgi:acyl-CoA synthetase (NDP forming)
MSRRIAETGYKMEAFLIQPFLQTRLELLVGGYRDPSFGPMVMFGTGGKYVEVWNDTSLRSAYLTEADIDEMINEVAVGKILKGVRGEAPIDIDKIKKVIRGVAQIMIDQTGIMEIDCNPLIITKAGETVCVDIRVRTK